ncbi:MAG: CoA-binding protein [Candidatus Micrarchaeota archaeon]
MNFEDFIKKSNLLAVVGASRDAEKYGYKIYHAIRREGFVVYPVNPNTTEIEGETCYPTIAALPKKPDVVVSVVPPVVTEQLVRQARQLGITHVWMQPGSEDDAAISYCEENHIAVVAKLCFVVDGLKKPL